MRQIYWTPPFRPLDPPLLKSDDLFFREPRDIGPPPFKNPGHAPEPLQGRPPVTPQLEFQEKFKTLCGLKLDLSTSINDL